MPRKGAAGGVGKLKLIMESLEEVLEEMGVDGSHVKMGQMSSIESIGVPQNGRFFSGKTY